MPWVRQGNQYVWVDDAGRAQPAPVDAPPPPERDIGMVTNAAPSPPPNTAQAPGGGPVNTRSPWDAFGIGEALRERFQGSIMNPTRDQPETPAAPTDTTGAIIGAETGGTPPLEFTPTETLPENAAAIALLQRILGEGVAGGAPGAAEPQVTGTPGERAQQDLESQMAFSSLGLPDPAQGDPGLSRRVGIAQSQRDRLTPFLERRLAELEARQGEREAREPHKVMIGDFAEWLGRLAAGGDLSQAQQIYSRMRPERLAREGAVDAEILRIAEALGGLEDRVGLAEADVASSAYGEGQRLEERDYERGFRERRLGIEDRRYSDSLALGLAQLLGQDAAAAREFSSESASLLAQTPGFESLGAQAQADLRFPDNPALAGAVSRSLAEQFELVQLLQQIMGPYGNRSDARDLRRQMDRALRQQGRPPLTDEQFRRVLQMASAQPAPAQ